MNYKVAADLNENFILDEKYEIWFVSRNAAGLEQRRVPVTNSIHKGYIYAAMFFHDFVANEVDKLKTMVRKIRDEVAIEQPSVEAPIKMLYVSRRVRELTGNDNLDALIKEILAEEKEKHIALVPDKEEVSKYDSVKDAIFTEVLSEFTGQTLGNVVVGEGGRRIFALSPKYIEKMTERQKAIFVPAVKMATFFFGFKLNDFQLLPAFTVSAYSEKLPEPFAVQEEEIKSSIKKFIKNAQG